MGSDQCGPFAGPLAKRHANATGTLQVLEVARRAGGPQEAGQRGGLGQVGEPELHGFILVGGSFSQQPANRKPAAGRGFADLVPGGPDPRATKREYMRLCPFRPLPGRDPYRAVARRRDRVRILG